MTEYIVDVKELLEDNSAASRIKFSQGKEYGDIVIDMKKLEATELRRGVTVVIPNKYDCLVSLKSEHPEWLDSIQRLVIPPLMTKLDANSFVGLTNLMKVDIIGKLESVDNLFDENKTLVEVTMQGAKYLCGCTFYNCDNLLAVEIGNQPRIIGNYTFANCRKLKETTRLFSEGLLAIGNYAFSECNSLASLNNIKLPKSLLSLSASAFDNCENISTLEITGKTGIECKLSSLYNGYDTTLLRSVTKAKVICPYDYPYRFLQKVVGKNVEVIRKQGSDEEKQKIKSKENRIIKAQALGIEVVSYDIPHTVLGIKETLKMIDKETFRNDMINILNAKLQSIREDEKIGLCLVGGNGMFININCSLSMNGIYDEEIEKAYLTEHYAIGVFREETIVIPITIDGILESIKIREEYIDKDYGGIIIPTYEYEIRYKDIEEIYEENEKVVIKTKDQIIRSGIREITGK